MTAPTITGRRRAREAALQMLYQSEVGRASAHEAIATYWPAHDAEPELPGAAARVRQRAGARHDRARHGDRRADRRARAELAHRADGGHRPPGAAAGGLRAARRAGDAGEVIINEALELARDVQRRRGGAVRQRRAGCGAKDAESERIGPTLHTSARAGAVELTSGPVRALTVSISEPMTDRRQTANPTSCASGAPTSRSSCASASTLSARRSSAPTPSTSSSRRTARQTARRSRRSAVADDDRRADPGDSQLRQGELPRDLGRRARRSRSTSARTRCRERDFAIFKLLDFGDLRRRRRQAVPDQDQRADDLGLVARVPGQVLRSRCRRSGTGCSDVEIRYRQRYLDLIVNPDSRRVFEVRSRCSRRSAGS